MCQFTKGLYTLNKIKIIRKKTNKWKHITVNNVEDRIIGELVSNTKSEVLIKKEEGRIKEIIANNCGIEVLPERIGELQFLKTLQLSENNLKKLPKSIINLKALECLCLDRNNLTNLPDSIGNLTNLTGFSACRNNIRNLPASLGMLKKLQILQLDGNQIEKLYAQILNLSPKFQSS